MCVHAAVFVCTGNMSFIDDDEYVTYLGQWQSGLPEGRGTMVYRTGRVYDGEWRQGMRHGRGMVYVPEIDENGYRAPRAMVIAAFGADVRDDSLQVNPSRVTCRFGQCEFGAEPELIAQRKYASELFSSEFKVKGLANLP